MRRVYILVFYCFICLHSFGQATPDKIYGVLFNDVQISRVFADSKTFVDCIPKKDPKEILSDYIKIKNNPHLRFSLKFFVEENFILPDTISSSYHTTEKNLKEHITNLWSVLKRNAKKPDSFSSLLPLPKSYIIPGGRFREVYYWDSYFTMLGLKESGEYETIENMVENFAYLINTYGHIPNGNRTYYLSRSQPPFFTLMVDLLASIKGNEVYAIYQPALQKEYDYWMDKTAGTMHVVKLPDGSTLNRYYDQLNIPRQESYYEDWKLVHKFYPEHREQLCRNIRSAAESGWDFSSRWFADQKNISSIQTTSFIPVDLNCLLYHLEKTLSVSYNETGNKLHASLYLQLAEKRKKAIEKYCWSEKNKWYVDYNIGTQKQSASLTLAGMFPFFLELSDEQKMRAAKTVLEKNFLKTGGVVTTTKQTGQQWDAPNGWAPLEWITIMGLDYYHENTLAKTIAQRWFDLNKKVYTATGKLMEKYNVVNTKLAAGGGEYVSQDGFGWTNGVLLSLMKKYNFN